MRKNFQKSTETIELGIYLHTADTTPVIRLTCRGIPYPNSPVLLNDKIIGKVDEVLGTMNEVYASVIVDKGVKLKEKCLLSGYRDKFMAKERFLPRTEVEKRKEESDRKGKSRDIKSMDGKRSNDRMRGDNKRDGKVDNKRSYDSKSYTNKRNKSENDRSYERDSNYGNRDSNSRKNSSEFKKGDWNRRQNGKFDGNKEYKNKKNYRDQNKNDVRKSVYGNKSEDRKGSHKRFD